MRLTASASAPLWVERFALLGSPRRWVSMRARVMATAPPAPAAAPAAIRRQVRHCALSRVLGQYLNEKAGRVKTDGQAAAVTHSRLAEFRAPAARGDASRGAAWRGAVDAIFSNLRAEGYEVFWKCRVAALASCPDYAAGRAMIDETVGGMGWHSAYWTSLLQVCLRSGEVELCEQLALEMVRKEAVGAEARGWSIADLDRQQHSLRVIEGVAHELSRAERYDDLHRLIEYVHSGTHLRLTPQLMCLFIRACRTYQQLKAVLDKGHVWRVTSRDIAETVVERSLVLQDPRCTALLQWLLRGDYARPTIVEYVQPAALGERPWQVSTPRHTGMPTPSFTPPPASTPPPNTAEGARTVGGARAPSPTPASSRCSLVGMGAREVPASPPSHAAGGAAEAGTRPPRAPPRTSRDVDLEGMTAAAAAEEILGDVQRALPRASRRNLWSSVWGGTVLLQVVLRKHDDALATYEQLRDSRLEMDFKCRKYLLRAAGLGIHALRDPARQRAFRGMADAAVDGVTELRGLHRAAVRGTLNPPKPAAGAKKHDPRSRTLGASADLIDAAFA